MTSCLALPRCWRFGGTWILHLEGRSWLLHTRIFHSAWCHFPEYWKIWELTALSNRRAQTLPHVVLFIRVSDYDICGLSTSLMSWFIVLYKMFLLSSPGARQFYRIEMPHLTGRNKRDTIPQDSASWKQSWRRHIDNVACTGSDFYCLMPGEVEGMLKEDVVTCFEVSNY
jgi:hypothetical protein